MAIKWKLFLVAAIILVGFLIFKASQIEFKEIEEKTNQEYPILELSDSISATIKSIYNPPKLRTSPFYVSVDFREGMQHTLSTKGYALRHSSIAIREVCVNGAALSKEAHSDTLEVTLKGEIYIFKLAEDD